MRRIGIVIALVLAIIVCPHGVNAQSWIAPIASLISLYNQNAVINVDATFSETGIYAVWCGNGSTGSHITVDDTTLVPAESVHCDVGEVRTYIGPIHIDGDNLNADVTVDKIVLSSACYSFNVYGTGQVDLSTSEAYIWSVENRITLYGDTVYDVFLGANQDGTGVPSYVSDGDLIDVDLPGGRPDAVIICEIPDPTATPTIPAAGCDTYYSQEMWNGAGYSDRIEFSGSMVGYSVTLTTPDRAPRIVAYQSDRDTPIGDEDWLLYNTPYLITIDSPWTFLDEAEGFTVSVCWVGDSATYTPTRTATRTAISTPNTSGITMTPVPECRTVAVSFDSFKTDTTTSPPYTESTFALYKSDLFTMSSNEYLVAVDRPDSSGAQTSMINVGNMKSANAMFTNFQIDVNGVPFEEAGGAFINGVALTGYRTYYSRHNLSGAYDAMYTANATLRVWFKNDAGTNQIIDHYEICEWSQPTPTPTITSNSVQYTAIPTWITVEPSVCIPAATAAPAQTGQIPDLSLIIPTLELLASPTITTTESPFINDTVYTMVAGLAAPAQTSAAWSATAFVPNGYTKGQSDAAPIISNVQTAFGWLTVMQSIGPLAWILPLVVITVGVRVAKPVLSLVRYVKQLIPFN